MERKRKKEVKPEILIENLKEENKNKTIKSHSSEKKRSKKLQSKEKKEKVQKSTPKSKDKKTSKEKKSSQNPDKIRKWNEKSSTFKRGKITETEEEKIINSLCEYGFENNLSPQDLLDIIIETQKKSNSKIWPVIASCLPDRSVQTIHNFCHRRFHPDNYKGGWTKEEEETLINLVKEHGKKWKIISENLQRTATNVKDKYKQLGGDNYNKIEKTKSLSLKLKLLKNIDNYLMEDNENESLFKYKYKFSPSLDKSENLLFKVDEEKKKMIIDFSMKEEESPCVIHNLLTQLLNFDVLTKIVEEKKEISWTTISNTLQKMSYDECRNEWNQILREFNLEAIINQKRNLKMIKK